MSDAQLNVAKVMAGLKDFQRTSVDYVFRRMYTDSDPTRRFLLADEVGLGKTMVAKGVVAKTIEHLRAAGVPRIDVLYICSNLDIATQNIERLRVTPEATGPLASRITLLPKMVHDLKDRALNFVTFTPGGNRSRGTRRTSGRASWESFGASSPPPAWKPSSPT